MTSPNGEDTGGTFVDFHKIGLFGICCQGPSEGFFSFLVSKSLKECIRHETPICDPPRINVNLGEPRRILYLCTI